MQPVFKYYTNTHKNKLRLLRRFQNNVNPHLTYQFESKFDEPGWKKIASYPSSKTALYQKLDLDSN